MQLFYTPDIVPPDYELNEEESRHAVRVLRVRQGDTLWLTDGRGNLYQTRVTGMEAKRCRVEVVRTEAGYGQRSYGLTMAVAPTKNPERYEWFLEKAVEVGVDRIIPMECCHSERRTFKHERALRLLVSAMKQSARTFLPELDELTPFREVVTLSRDAVKLIAHCNMEGDRKTMAECIAPGDNVMVLIGPEGDFSPEEVALARANGFTEITLGDTRLRTETAALTAVMFTAFVNSYCALIRNSR